MSYGRIVYAAMKIYLNGTSTVLQTYSSSGSQWQEWPSGHVDAGDYIYISTAPLTSGSTHTIYMATQFLED